MAHPGGSRGDDDDATRVVFRKDSGGEDTTVLGDQRGTLIGVADIQRQVRVAGKDGDATMMHPRAGAPGSQGETIFLAPGQSSPKPGAPKFDPVVGWLVVTSGPGRGQFRPVFYGQNSIGRGPDQRISIDFGDQRISREAHAFIIYDEVQRMFFIRDNGKSNLVRHKGNLVMMPTEIFDRDEITIGDTSLMFVALCNSSFDWLASDEPSKA
jgi:FHA domain-containing protein